MKIFCTANACLPGSRGSWPNSSWSTIIEMRVGGEQRVGERRQTGPVSVTQMNRIDQKGRSARCAQCALIQ
jgi:hypothetical protein